MAKKGVLITGGSGLVGSYAVSMLQEQGERPVIFSITGNKRRLEAFGVNPNSLEFVRGDVLDLPSLISTIHDHEINRVIHLASFLGEETQRHPYSGVRLNLLGTVNVLEAARLEGVSKVVLSSSAVVYRGSLNEDSHEMIDETVMSLPLSIYSATKLGAEVVGFTYARRFKFDFIVVRFPALYGPSLIIKLKARREQAIKAMVRAALKNEAVTIHWPYEPAEILYGKDAAKGVVLACLKENLRQNTFNIGYGKLVNVDDIVGALKKHFPKAKINLSRGKTSTAHRKKKPPIDYSCANEQLGYKPEYSPDRALRDYAETLKKIEGL